MSGRETQSLLWLERLVRRRPHPRQALIKSPQTCHLAICKHVRWLVWPTWTLPTHLVSLHEGIDGARAKLVHRDRTGLGSELFQIDYYGSQPNPHWASRPYLCHAFLVQQQQQQYSPVGDGESTSNKAVSFDSLDPAVQQACVVREALLALSGVQGTLIKVLPSRKALTLSGVEGRATAKRQLRFSVDTDACSDRSTVAQIEQVLPVCVSMR